MQSFTYYFLAGFLMLAAVLFFSKDKTRKLAGDALLVLATIFVALSFYHTATDAGRLAKSAPVIEADKAELQLKLAQAIRASGRLFVSPKIIDRRQQHGLKPTIEKTDQQAEVLLHESQKILDSLVQKNPNAPVLEAKYALVTHEAGDPNSMSLERLSHIDTDNGHKLHKALSVVYAPTKPSHDEVKVAEETFKTILPPGWYRDTALLELYKRAGMTSAFNELQARMDESALKLLGKMVALIVIMLFSFFAGIIVIIVQLFFLGRKVTDESQVALIRPPVKYDFRTIYGVFIAWMATQHLFGQMIQEAVKSWEIFNHGVMVAACATAGLYLLSNGPGLIYIYLIAVKPHGLKFFETVKIRGHVGKLGPGRLVLAGLLTWFAAIPVVVVSYLIATKLMNSQGSSNPIIAIVMEAARSADLPAVVMFYITLGVLAPICEETLFRGFLYPSLRQYWGVLPCLIVTAALFAGVHMDMGGFLPLFSLGFLFGFVVEKTKSIIPSMVAHGLWNSGTFTLVLMLFGN